MTDALYIHCSSLDFYSDCPRRWAARTLRREIAAAGWVVRDETLGIGAAIGTAVHLSAKTVLDEVAAGRPLPPPDVATDAAQESLKESTARGVQYDKVYTQGPQTAERQTRRMTLSYHTHVAPRRQPVFVEKRFEAPVPWTAMKIILTGQPDLVAREPNSIDDLKAGVRRGNHNAQAGGYSLLGRSHGLQIDGANIDWVPRVPIKKPQPLPVERHLDVALSEQMAVNTIRQIDVAVTTWRKGDAERGLLPGDPSAFPANPASMLCSARYCSAHSCGKRNSFCNEWRKDED